MGGVVVVLVDDEDGLAFWEYFVRCVYGNVRLDMVALGIGRTFRRKLEELYQNL